MDLGVECSGFDVLAQMELDPHCCATLRAAGERNKSDTIVIENDIRQIEPNLLRKRLNLKKNEIDLLFGGPPCQSFSLAGKQKGLEDDRGLLLFEMIRFAEEFQPKVILLEQVKGLLSSKGHKGHKGEVFNDFLARMEYVGYIPKWRVLMAADFGVPQLRERLFVIAVRGENRFEFPERTHAPRDECNGLFSYQPYVTVGDVLGGLGNPDPKVNRCTHYNREDGHVDVTPLRDRERIEQVPEGSYLAAQMHLKEELRCGLRSKDTTKYLRLSRSRPSNTLRCGEIFFHPDEDRYLTPREYMRIQGYPDSYVLKGPIRSRTGSVKNLDQHRQIANSVPPPVAKALASRIRQYLAEQYHE